ncbi:hypothetical protein [Chromobacterium piscinae]|uniref:hypothetical protein n=1 Tax=Chromobacterium piscinae TaxID=686831 RepID=UPI0032088F9D
MPFELPQQPAPELPARWCVFNGSLLWLQDQQLPAHPPAGCALTGQRFLGIHEDRNLFMADRSWRIWSAKPRRKRENGCLCGRR